MSALAAYDYELPAGAIAQTPASPRDSSRLLVAGDPIRHLRTRDFPELLGPDDLVVVNDSRVLAARLLLRKPTGGAVEVLLLEPRDGGWWHALVRPSRKVPVGMQLEAAGEPAVEVGEPTGDGGRLVRPLLDDLADRVGQVPLPPYITAELADPGRYQTVYADEATSVAAPTAGLHLTDAVLARCPRVARLNLAVGMGTFKPIESDDVDDHRMHGERYTIPVETWRACQEAARVVAVGTTVVRALESAAASGGALVGRTELFIRPGHEFGVVDTLLTNFHMPRSSLLVLLAAFMGEGWRELYRTALAEGYRFLSFGDAMIVDRC